MAKTKGPHGLIDAKLAPCGAKPNCVCSEDQTPQSRRVKPLPSGSVTEIRAAIQALGGDIVRDANGYLSAEFVVGFFKFTDDLEIRIDGDIAHVRSASRVGYSDMGVNRKRVEALRAQLTG